MGDRLNHQTREPVLEDMPRWVLPNAGVLPRRERELEQLVACPVCHIFQHRESRKQLGWKWCRRQLTVDALHIAYLGADNVLQRIADRTKATNRRGVELRITQPCTEFEQRQ